jgi:hypothetical protein
VIRSCEKLYVRIFSERSPVPIYDWWKKRNDISDENSENNENYNHSNNWFFSRDLRFALCSAFGLFSLQFESINTSLKNFECFGFILIIIIKKIKHFISSNVSYLKRKSNWLKLRLREREERKKGRFSKKITYEVLRSIVLNGYDNSSRNVSDTNGTLCSIDMLSSSTSRTWHHTTNTSSVQKSTQFYFSIVWSFAFSFLISM